jgi:hypothetical protein
MVVLFAGMIILSRMMSKRAAREVVHILRQHDAIGAENAKTIDELGLGPSGFAERMFRLRDYRPAALSALIAAGVVEMTSEGNLFLPEDIASGAQIQARAAKSTDLS